MVNNAGFGLLGPAASLDRAEQLAMVDLNVRALTELSLAFVDSLKRRNGGILNVGSVAGFLPGPGMAVYYATKAYVLSFSEALHQELKARGVRVTVLCPGPGADRVPGARRREQHDLSAPPCTLRRTSGRRRLSRAQGGPRRGRSGRAQQGRHGSHPPRAAPTAAGSHRAASEASRNAERWREPCTPFMADAAGEGLMSGRDRG